MTSPFARSSRPAQASATPSFRLSPAEQRALFDRILLTVIPPVALGLAVLYLIFAVGHVLLLEGQARQILLPLALATAVIFFVLWRFGSTGRIEPQSANQVAVAMPLLALANVLTHTYLTQEIEQTTSLLLLIIGSGLFLLLRSSLILVIVTAVGGWLLVGVSLSPNALMIHYSFALLIAIMIAVVIQHVHRITFLRVERLRKENAWRSDLALAASEQRYQRIFDNIGLPIVELDWTPIRTRVAALKAEFPGTWQERFALMPRYPEDDLFPVHFVEVNQAALELLGFENKEQLTAGVPAVLLPETAVLIEKTLQAVVQGKTEFEEVSIIKTRTGDRRYIRLNMNMLTGVEANRALVIFRDITAEKKAEAALRENEERYHTFVEQSSEGIFRAEPLKPIPITQPVSRQIDHILNTAVLVECNDAMARIFGYARGDDLVGKQIEALVPPTSDAVTTARTFIENGYRIRDVETVEYDTHGQAHTILSSVVGIVKYDLLIGAWGIQRDITAEKQAEDALRQSEARYQAFVEQSSEGIFRLELKQPISIALPEAEQVAYLVEHCRIAECNDALARMFGFEQASQLIGRRINEWTIQSADNLNHASMFVRSGYRIQDAVTQEINRNGDLLYIRSNFIGIVENGLLLGVWGVRQDITAQTNAQAALRQAQKLESLGVMSSGIAHDFNNLLLAMLAQTFLAQAKLPADHAAQLHLARAADAAERGAQLTRQLLAFTGRAQTEIEPVNLNDLIEANLHLFEVAVARNIQLERQLDPTPAIIEADVGQIQQIVMNLIMNAAEAYDGASGVVTIATCHTRVNEDDPRRQVLSGDELTPGSYAVLQVSDAGSGMDSETLTRIFDPFFTTKFTGRGLGLAAVLGIVRGHGGGIQVESEPGEGTTFTVYLPTTTAVTGQSAPCPGSRRQNPQTVTPQ